MYRAKGQDVFSTLTRSYTSTNANLRVSKLYNALAYRKFLFFAPKFNDFKRSKYEICTPLRYLGQSGSLDSSCHALRCYKLLCIS